MQKILARFRTFYFTRALHCYRLRVRFEQWSLRHGVKLAILILSGGMLLSVSVMPWLQRVTGDYFNRSENLATLRTLLSGTGSALIGATAIAFSLVVFAMQINVERMPHGLFRNLSSDRRLLGAFLGTFVIALVIAASSLIPEGRWALPAILTALWGTILILVLFLCAYRRALQLINPVSQLNIMLNSVRRELHKWDRRAEKAAILMDDPLHSDTGGDKTDSTFNASRSAFFKINADWTKTADQSVQYAISYAKRYAEQGDYEVTQCAFECVMRVNAAYCAVRRGTFIGSNPFFSRQDVPDAFINTTLELLRQTMQSALSKGDERLAGHTLRGITSLYGVYLAIDYPGRDRGKHHALLAAGYLGSAVESTMAHNMPDLMMEGIRLMGTASKTALDHTRPDEIVMIAEKIGTLSTVGVLNANHQPVTLTAFVQLADITYSLLLKGKQDIQYPVRQLRHIVSHAARRFLETPDRPFSSLHSSTLGPYFSATSVESLRGKLTPLVNALLDAAEDDSHAGDIIGNIETWADQISSQHKELLLLAVQKNSLFAFDAIAWAVGVPELLNALSRAPACSPHLQDALRKHAIGLVSTLTWLPDDRESVMFVETNFLTESLFEAAMAGVRLGCQAFYERCKDILMSWAIRGARHDAGMGILENAVAALVVLAIREGTPAAADVLKAQFRKMLTGDNAPTPEVRGRVAAHLVRRVSEARRYAGIPSSRIEHELALLEHGAASALIHEMAEILAPGQIRPQ